MDQKSDQINLPFQSVVDRSEKSLNEDDYLYINDSQRLEKLRKQINEDDTISGQHAFRQQGSTQSPQKNRIALQQNTRMGEQVQLHQGDHEVNQSRISIDLQIPSSDRRNSFYELNDLEVNQTVPQVKSLEVASMKYKFDYGQKKNSQTQQLTSMQHEFFKKSPHKLQRTLLYYCTIEQRVFKYYKNNQRNKPLGILDFDTQEYYLELIKDKKDRLIGFNFLVQDCPKIFEFQIVDKSDTKNQLFLDLAEFYLKNSKGKMQHLIALTLSYRFWRHCKISENEISQTAQTGDVLIFRSKGVLPAVQRSITGSDVDHIVMFLRYDKQNLHLFESSNQYGVIEFSYHRFVQVQSYTHYEKIIYKKLENLSELDRQKLLNIAIQQIGKGYSLSVMKLIRKSTRSNFFCSELIAYVYQMIGLISPEEKACKFLPGDFTHEKQPIQLNKNASLSQDYVVDFYNY